MSVLAVFCINTCWISASEPPDRKRASLRQKEEALVHEILAPLRNAGVLSDAPSGPQPEPLCDVSGYAKRVRTEHFTEIWPDAHGKERGVAVKAEIWTDAIQAALNEHAGVTIPQRDRPYYIDRPLILRSGHRLLVGPNAEIRLKPGSNCCMVRNEHVVNGEHGPVTLTDDADHDIVIRGGIWTTLATSGRQSNGNTRGLADPKGSIKSHGVILLSNITRFRVASVTVRQCKPHGIQLSNCTQFCVEGVRFEDHRRDGVHINGPAGYGVIRDVRVQRGVMGDDMVALNAWDWKNTVTSFGLIHHVLVEDIHGDPVMDGASGAPKGHRSEIRLLAGTKHFGGSKTLDCNIEHCVIRKTTGIRTFKMYDQPNLELGRHRDFADPIGRMRNLFFADITIGRPTGAEIFQIHSNVSGMAIRNVTLGFDPNPPGGKPFTLVRIGPLSMTYKHNPRDPKTWVEVFSPNKDCVVEGLSITGVRAQGKDANPDTLVHVIKQHVNKDYPRSTPRGGTGKGILK